MNEKYNNLIGLVPSPGELIVDWDRIMRSELSPYFKKMAETMQNPEWHGEGDVWTHTKMVCEGLIRLEAWRKLERHRQEELFIAALLHDIGKTACTRIEDGVPTSPYHTSVGDRMVRSILWKDYGMSGSYDVQQFRETVCSLIKNHSKPFHFYHEKSPEYKAIRIASTGSLVPHFSNELLALLVEADIRGRVAKDTDDRLQHLHFFKEISKEAGCLEQPIAFPSPFSRYAYLSGRNILPGQELYDDTWGTVVLLAGLPGTGKDVYTREVYPDLPMVSLDVFREEMGISPKESQDKVVGAAKEQAKKYLRQSQPFLWNATNITPMIRKNQAELFVKYKAAVKIVFLETSWDQMLIRNRERENAVPEPVIVDMLEKLSPPDFCEAHDVEWVLT